jgi:hypothetical protein
LGWINLLAVRTLENLTQVAAASDENGDFS